MQGRSLAAAAAVEIFSLSLSPRQRPRTDRPLPRRALTASAASTVLLTDTTLRLFLISSSCCCYSSPSPPGSGALHLSAGPPRSLCTASCCRRVSSPVHVAATARRLPDTDCLTPDLPCSFNSTHAAFRIEASTAEPSLRHHRRCRARCAFTTLSLSHFISHLVNHRHRILHFHSTTSISNIAPARNLSL